jgi:hypothetical protein
MAMADTRAGTVLYHLRRLVAAQRGNQQSDQSLIQRFVDDSDDAAFEVLVRRHGPMVLRVCRQVLRHAQDAEDAFQATFLVLARKAAAIKKRASPAPRRELASASRPSWGRAEVADFSIFSSPRHREDKACGHVFALRGKAWGFSLSAMNFLDCA